MDTVIKIGTIVNKCANEHTTLQYVTHEKLKSTENVH